MQSETVTAIATMIENSAEALRIGRVNIQSLLPEDQKEFSEIETEFHSCISDTNEYCMTYQPFYAFLSDNLEGSSVDELLEYLAQHNFDQIIPTVKRIATSTFDLANRIQRFNNCLSEKYVSLSPKWRCLDVIFCVGGISLLVRHPWDATFYNCWCINDRRKHYSID